MHRLQALHRRLPGRRDRRCARLHAHGGRRLVHRLRALRAPLPGRLHRHGAAARRMEHEPEACRRRARAAAAAAPRGVRSSLARRRRAQKHPGGSTRSQMNPAKRRKIYERLRAANPHPTTELKYGTPFELLVSVVLSAQATDKSVNLATAKLFPATPDKIVKLGVAGLEGYIKSIGLYRTKAKNVVALSQLLLEKHCGAVPQNREALEALPGVGRKTANVVLNTAFGEPTVAVDTHIFRVANRTKLAPGKDPLEVELKLLKFTPPEFLQNAHHWLILHGRYICIARKPGCPECLIRDLCEFGQKTRV